MPAAAPARALPSASCRLPGRRGLGWNRCRSRLMAHRDVLNEFWLAQGVNDERQRRRLVEMADELPSTSGSAAGLDELESSGGLPGLSATWALDVSAAGSLPQVAEVSRRLRALKQLLGGQDDVDVVFMVVREPRLLSTDVGTMARRLLDLRLAGPGAGGAPVDVVKLAEAQPALLLDDGGGRVCPEESPEERLSAWSHGLVSDGPSEWAARFAQLEAYAAQHGDAHAGFRDGEPPGLGRWAAKQRSAAAAGTLAGERAARLQELGFEFESEEAEWLRWLTEVRRYKARHGHCNPPPLAAGSDFLLLNWCAVQRIARRSRVLPPHREALLSELGFEWTGADALS